MAGKQTTLRDNVKTEVAGECLRLIALPAGVATLLRTCTCVLSFFRIRASRGLVACAPSCLTAKIEKFQLQDPALPGFCFPAQYVQPGSSPLSHLVELLKVYSGQILANNHNTFVRPFTQIPNPLPVRTLIYNWIVNNTAPSNSSLCRMLCTCPRDRLSSRCRLY